MERSSTLSEETEKRLMEMVGRMEAGQNRFLPEERLAKELSISRATLREALQSLINGGFITPRHGSGNYGHPSATELRHRIDLSSDFLILSDAGDQTVTCECRRCGYIKAPERMKQYYPVPCGDVYELQWVYSADAKPTILSRIYIPTELLIGEPEESQTDGREMLADWIRRCCGRDFAYYATYLSCAVDDSANEMLGLPAGTALQNWRQVTYDLFDEPVAFCDNFFHNENIELTTIMRP